MHGCSLALSHQRNAFILVTSPFTLPIARRVVTPAHCHVSYYCAVCRLGLWNSLNDLHVIIDKKVDDPQGLIHDKVTWVRMKAWRLFGAKPLHELHVLMTWLTIAGPQWVDINSLAPGKFEWNFRYVIFKWVLVMGGWGISCLIALIWMSFDFTDYQSILVQVMAWCRQATSYYLSQCWPRFLSPSGVTRPQWVNAYLQLQ